MILQTRNVKRNKITHSHTKIDRCCKSFGWDQDVRHIKFNGRDRITRIPCTISKKYFVQNYVLKRKHVILQNCTDTWKASNWTFQGNLVRISISNN